MTGRGTLAELQAAGIDKAALVVLLVGVGLLVHAFAYHASEGALRANRQLLRRGADLVTFALAAFALRIWL